MANMLKYKGYHGSVAFSAEDNLLVGSVIGIRDSLNFHGNSIEEITQSFHDSIDGYLEMCEALGLSPDKEYKGSFNVRISPDLHRQAALTAEKEGVSLNQLIQQAIEEHLAPAQYKNVVVAFPAVQSTTLVRSLGKNDNSNRYQSHASGVLC